MSNATERATATLARLGITLPFEGALTRWVSLGKRLHLIMWDTGERYPTGQTKLGYALIRGKSALFHGTDYGCAPGHPIDSDAAVWGLLGFLTLRPGDTDPEYFASYTERQRAWAKSSECENLALLAYDYENAKQLAREDSDFRAPKLRNVARF